MCQGAQTRKITLRWKSCSGVKLSQTPECIHVAAGLTCDVAKVRLLVAVRVQFTTAGTCDTDENDHPNL